MVKRVLMFWLLGGMACGAEQPTVEEEVLDREALEELEDQRPSDLPPMPAPPAGRPGHLSAVIVGPYAISGTWEAVTGSCEDPALLQLMSEVPGAGTIIVLVLDEGQRVGQYPVARVGRDLPPPPAAQVGVQFVDGEESYGFQGEEGHVDVYEYGSTVSARFAVTLREIRTRDLVQYAGVFEGIPLVPLADEYCAQLRVGADSASSAVR